jgi:hypothetical protein
MVFMLLPELDVSALDVLERLGASADLRAVRLRSPNYRSQRPKASLRRAFSRARTLAELDPTGLEGSSASELLEVVSLALLEPSERFSALARAAASMVALEDPHAGNAASLATALHASRPHAWLSAGTDPEAAALAEELEGWLEPLRKLGVERTIAVPGLAHSVRAQCTRQLTYALERKLGGFTHAADLVAEALESAVQDCAPERVLALVELKRAEDPSDLLGPDALVLELHRVGSTGEAFADAFLLACPREVLAYLEDRPVSVLESADLVVLDDSRVLETASSLVASGAPLRQALVAARAIEA